VIRRAASLVLIVWALGFAWFALILPLPLGAGKSDAVIVLTGGEGRIARAFEVLDKGWAKQILVAGVDPEVRRREFAVEFEVKRARMACCVTLESESVDTRSNASESARWIAAENVRSVRLVTSDWHMRRAAWELEQAAPPGTVFARDAVPTRPSFRILFLEYHKLLARRIGSLFGY